MIKIKVQAYSLEKPIETMNKMLSWVIDTFPNEMDPDRWTYGRDTSPEFGGTLLNGPFEIEYFEFRDEEDASMFKLVWS